LPDLLIVSGEPNHQQAFRIRGAGAAVTAESGTAHAYDQSAEEAGWQAEPHRINLALEPVDFLKGIHRRKIEQAKQSEAHFRKQAARVQSREA
jgi:hypothetical protein